MKYMILQKKHIVGQNLSGIGILLLIVILNSSIGYGQEKKESRIVRPVFSIFTSISLMIDNGSLGTVVAPLTVSGIELYLGIPKIYLYLSGSFAYSLVINDIYNYGGAFNTRFGLGGHVYSNYTSSKDKWWTLAVNGGGLFTVTMIQQQDIPLFSNKPSKGHRAFFFLGAFVNLRAFYHFHKNVALMIGYDLTWYAAPELKSFENGITIGLAF